MAFAVVVHAVRDEDDARAIAKRAADAATLLVSAVAEPRDRPLVVRVSTGVRLLAPGQTSATAALRDAEVALYVSKADGWAAVELRREGRCRADQERDKLSQDLRPALRSDQLRLFYQPVVDAGALRVRGVEALARWRHPVRGDVPPDAFVACARNADDLD